MWCVCACVLHLDVCMCVFLCLHLVCEFTAEWRHTAACYSKGRGPQGKSTPTGQDLESLRRQVCISAGPSQASASRREEKGFWEKEESTWEKAGRADNARHVSRTPMCGHAWGTGGGDLSGFYLAGGTKDRQEGFAVFSAESLTLHLQCP